MMLRFILEFLTCKFSIFYASIIVYKLVIYLFVVVQSLFIPSYDASRIPFLRGDNFKEWKEKILLTLGCMDLDLALRVDEPLVTMEFSTQQEKALYDCWEWSNYLSMMLIKGYVGKSIRGFILDCANVKHYLNAIEQQFETSDKALTSTLMSKLSSMKFKGTKVVYGNEGYSCSTQVFEN